MTSWTVRYHEVPDQGASEIFEFDLCFPNDRVRVRALFPPGESGALQLSPCCGSIYSFGPGRTRLLCEACGKEVDPRPLFWNSEPGSSPSGLSDVFETLHLAPDPLTNTLLAHDGVEAFRSLEAKVEEARARVPAGRILAVMRRIGKFLTDS